MKKLIQSTLLSILLIALGFAPAALAADSCTLTNTGPNSSNTCTFNDNNSVTVTCSNGVDVTNANSQTSGSGAVTVNGNTVSGSSTSGESTNQNDVANYLAQFCLAAAPVTPAPTPSGSGAGAGQAAPQVAGVSTTKVAALPNTGPNTVATSAALSAAAVSGALLAAQALVNVYRRRALK